MSFPWLGIIAILTRLGKSYRKTSGESSSYRFTLAIQNVFRQHKATTDLVYQIMLKLQNLNVTAKLRKFTNLQPHFINQTRWSSTYLMLRCYVALWSFLKQLEMEETFDLVLNPRQDRVVIDILEMLKKFDSVTKLLQRDGTRILNARSFFDSIITNLPLTFARLKPDANIVRSPIFESARYKFQNWKEHCLSFTGSDVVLYFVAKSVITRLSDELLS